MRMESPLLHALLSSFRSTNSTSDAGTPATSSVTLHSSTASFSLSPSVSLLKYAPIVDAMADIRACLRGLSPVSSVASNCEGETPLKLNSPGANEIKSTVPQICVVQQVGNVYQCDRQKEVEPAILESFCSIHRRTCDSSIAFAGAASLLLLLDQNGSAHRSG